jgi:hypothetical protein
LFWFWQNFNKWSNFNNTLVYKLLAILKLLSASLFVIATAVWYFLQSCYSITKPGCESSESHACCHILTHISRKGKLYAQGWLCLRLIFNFTEKSRCKTELGDCSYISAYQPWCNTKTNALPLGDYTLRNIWQKFSVFLDL